MWPSSRRLWPASCDLCSGWVVSQRILPRKRMARICREAKKRVRTNVFLRDVDLAMPGVADGRRLEVVVDGLPLRGRSHLPWTRPWCAHCIRTALPDGMQQKERRGCFSGCQTKGPQGKHRCHMRLTVTTGMLAGLTL